MASGGIGFHFRGPQTFKVVRKSIEEDMREGCNRRFVYRVRASRRAFLSNSFEELSESQRNLRKNEKRKRE
ncbi:hypothetical protein NPIL_83281 [Nephila pilipes]|uniref:Uncharacterized protein n=1 Tax=Nephila pilipes TaxID=299642 RepID=A0A8X6N571_NEPPI|nr:hypothetical protein NPIL_83281 [Nephila pilipes]